MERVKLYCRGVSCGEAELCETDGRLEIRAEMPDPGDGLYRAVLVGERGELSLGVMEPRDGALVLRRRPELCETARIGAVRSVRAGCSFPFRKKSAWRATDCPAELFRDELLRAGVRGQTRAWWRREQGRLTVALPMKPDAEFPLVSLFCFARVERMEGELCAVFSFDERELPVHGKKVEFS